MRARGRNAKIAARVAAQLTPQIQSMINTALQSMPPAPGSTTEPINEVTAQSYTLQASDIGKEVQRNSAVANVTLLPSTSVIPVGTKQIPIVQTGTGPSTIAPASASIAVVPPDGESLTVISRYAGVFAKPVGTDRWRIFGSLAKLGAPTWSVNPSISPITGVQGVQITAADGTYTAGATVQSRSFLIDGAVAGSGSTYTPSAGNVGHDLQFQIVIIKDGLTAVFTTPALRIVAAGDPKPQPNGVGTITGNNRQGDVVTLTVGGYSNAVAGTPGHTVRLYRGATLIQTYTLAAATLTQTYTLAALDVSQNLTMTYQGTNASGQGAESQHSVAFPVAGNPPQYTPGTASITPAVPIVGAVLTANVGTVTGATGSPTFEWYRAGSLIVGETGSQYTTQSGSSSGVVIPTDVGKNISAVGIVSNAWGTTRINIPGVVVQAAAPPPDTPIPFDNGVPDGGTVIFQGSLSVGPRPVGMHWTQFTESYGGSEGGPVVASDTLRINAFRIYGSNALYWRSTEPNADGNYDWSDWDIADAFFARSGIEYVQHNLYGVPDGYRAQPESGVGGWSMQRPTSIVALHNYLTALFNRYSRLKMVEVANEVWTDNRGIAYGGFWVPSVVAPAPDGEASLFELMNWVLDWRNAYNAANPTRNIKVQAPSIPGTMWHAGFYLEVLDRYQAIHGRLAEFDSFSIHCYNTDFTNVHLQGPSGSGLYEFCQGLVARGLGGKEVRDGERGFPANTAVSPARVYNTVVRELLLGAELGIWVSGIDFFYYGSPGTDETNLGQPNPYYDASLRANGYEHAALLANCTITRVTAGAGTGVNAGKWRVEGFLGSAPAPSPAPPPGPPSPPPPGPPPPPPPAPSPNAPVMVTSAPNSSAGTPSATAVAIVPDGVEDGDRLTMAVSLIDSTKTITNPTGWGTPISTQTSGSGASHVRTQVYERVAASEPASYNITLSGTANWCTTILRITGDTATPTLDVADEAAGDEPTDPTAPSITTMGANRLLVGFAGQLGGGGITWGAVPGWNVQDTIWEGFPSNLASMFKTQATAGASGTGVFDSDGSPGDVWTGHMLAYKQ